MTNINLYLSMCLTLKPGKHKTAIFPPAKT